MRRKKSKFYALCLLTLSSALSLTACAPPTGEPTPPADVSASARQALAQKLEISTQDVRILSAEKTQWPDACLGMAEEGELCAQVITPGWRLTLEAQGERFEAHTDENGQQVRIGSD